MSEIDAHDKKAPAAVRSALEFIERLSHASPEAKAELAQKLPSFALSLAATAQPAKATTNSVTTPQGTSFSAAYDSLPDQLAWTTLWDNWDNLLNDFNVGNPHALKKAVETFREGGDRKTAEEIIKHASQCVFTAIRNGDIETLQYLKDNRFDFANTNWPWFLHAGDNYDKLDVLLFFYDCGYTREDVPRRIMEAAVARNNLDTAMRVYSEQKDADTESAEKIFHGCIKAKDRERTLRMYELIKKHQQTDKFGYGFEPLNFAVARKDWDAIEFVYELGFRNSRYGNQLDLEKYLAWHKTHRFVPPGSLLLKNPKGVSPKILHLVGETLQHRESIHETTAWEIAYNTSLIFSAERQLIQYMQKWAKPTKQPLHDVLQQIILPPAGLKGINLKDWGDAIVKHGPEMAKLVKFADKLPSPEKAPDGSWSMTLTRKTLGKFVYSRAKESPDLASLFFMHARSEESFEDALALMNEKKRAKTVSNLPKIIIDGAAFGMVHASFKRLDDNDPRGLILGELTDCCQSIGGHGHDCAVHGYAAENGGFYVIAVNDDKKGEQIIGQAWAWRGKKDELVLDTLETLGNRVNSVQWTHALQAFAKRLEENASDITALMVGKGGGTPKHLPFNKASRPAMPKDAYDGYRESSSQIVVWKRKPTQKTLS